MASFSNNTRTTPLRQRMQEGMVKRGVDPTLSRTTSVMSGAPPRLLDRLMAVMQARRPTNEPCVPRSRSPITFTLPGRPIGKPMRDSSCRTAALGGRVEACDDCGGRRIAYNSCQNRHCPKCQGAAARVWLAEREADLFPVGYFHVFFTSPAEVAVIAFYNTIFCLRPHRKRR